jgi:hypothetical protein
MRKSLVAALFVLAALGGTVILSSAGFASATEDISADVVEDLCNQDLDSPERLPEGILLLAQMDRKYKCLEKCNKPRYDCESEAKQKAKPGTKPNWEASTKCQEKYVNCLEKCE